MKSFFSKTFSTTPSKKQPSQPPLQLQDMLSKAEDIMKQLNSSRGGDQQWPLLNEATRTVQLLEGAVTKMADTDMKIVWRTQVDELQKRLQEATQALLTGDAGVSGTYEVPSNSGYPGPQGIAAPDDDQGASLFSGLDLGSSAPAPQTQAMPLALGALDALDAPPLGDAGGLFSGLDLLQPASTDTASGTRRGSGSGSNLDQFGVRGDSVRNSVEIRGSAEFPVPGDPFASSEPLGADASVPGSIVTSAHGRRASGLAGDAGVGGGTLLAGLTVGGEADAAPVTPQAVPQTPVGVAGGPLPEDLFSMMDDLVAVPVSHSSSIESITRDDLSSRPSADSERDSQSAAGVPLSVPASRVGPDVPESPLSTRSGTESTSGWLKQPSALADGGTAGRGPAPGPVGTGAAVPPTSTARKKKITRRVGYARGEEEGAETATLRPAGDQAPTASPSTVRAPASSSPAGGINLLASDPVAIPAPAVSYDLASFATPQLTPVDHDHMDLMHSVQVPLSRSPIVAGTGSAGTPHSASVTVQPAVGVARGILPNDSAGPSLDGLLEATEGQGFDSRLKAVQAATSESIEQLTRKLAGHREEERTAKERRHQLVSRLTACKGEMAELEAAEARAAEAEDFDTAAATSARLDEVKGRAARLQHDLNQIESSSKSAVANRAELLKKQAGVWRKAAQLLQQLQQQQRQHAEQVLQESAAAAKRAEAVQAEGAELLGGLEQRIAVRQKWVEGEEAALASKLDEATRPIAGARESAVAAHSALLLEVEALRAALAEKEAALEEAARQLAAVEEQMKSLSAKYDKTRQVLTEDRHQLEAQIAERDAEAAVLAAAAAEAAASREASAKEAATFQAQAEAAEQAALEMAGKAEEVEAQASSEQRFQHLQQRLRELSLAASQKAQELEKEVEEARGQGQALVSRRAAMLNEARSQDEAAAASSRRVTELEIEKKAAASARDFKEAGRLAEQAKALAGQADAAAARAAGLRADVARIREEEAAQAARLAALESQLASASRESGLALWRCLQASKREAQQQQDRAAAQERFADADLLEADIAATTAEADALAQAHAFTPADLDTAWLDEEGRDDSTEPGPAASPMAETKQPAGDVRGVPGGARSDTAGDPPLDAESTSLKSGVVGTGEEAASSPAGAAGSTGGSPLKLEGSGGAGRGPGGSPGGTAGETAHLELAPDSVRSSVGGLDSSSHSLGRADLAAVAPVDSLLPHQFGRGEGSSGKGTPTAGAKGLQEDPHVVGRWSRNSTESANGGSLRDPVPDGVLPDVTGHGVGAKMNGADLKEVPPGSRMGTLEAMYSDSHDGSPQGALSPGHKKELGDVLSSAHETRQEDALLSVHPATLEGVPRGVFKAARAEENGHSQPHSTSPRTKGPAAAPSSVFFSDGNESDVTRASGYAADSESTVPEETDSPDMQYGSMSAQTCAPSTSSSSVSRDLPNTGASESKEDPRDPTAATLLEESGPTMPRERPGDLDGGGGLFDGLSFG